MSKSFPQCTGWSEWRDCARPDGGEQLDITPPDEVLAGIWSSTDAVGIGGSASSGPLTFALVGELFANGIYFNTHTNLFPSGEFRGQLINQGAVGLATGTGGARNFSNLTGGSGNDTLIGVAAATTFASGGKTPSDVALGDSDSDGDLDLFVANRNSHHVVIFLNPGNGSFSIPAATLITARFPQYLALGELNGDGRIDIVAGSSSGNKLSIIHSVSPLGLRATANKLARKARKRSSDDRRKERRIYPLRRDSATHTCHLY